MPVVVPAAASHQTAASTDSASDAIVPASVTTGFRAPALSSAAAVPSAAIPLDVDDDEWMSSYSDDDSEWSEPCTDDLDADEVEAALAVPPPSATALYYLPSAPPVHSPATIAALCILTVAVSHGEPDEDPAVEHRILGQMWGVKQYLCGIYTGAIRPRNGYPSTQPLPTEEEDELNPTPGNAELDSYEDYLVAQFGDLEGINDDGWNFETPGFDPTPYIEPVEGVDFRPKKSSAEYEAEEYDDEYDGLSDGSYDCPSDDQ
ncbi:hypothetical protein AURDEDRAFT_151617 [Auricularia subglabra TFB-10046 SS5]|nr:hypothetical protein AURDEDRAFT_151617 [Auricularia subglabra TFB-10046 SS5]